MHQRGNLLYACYIHFAAGAGDQGLKYKDQNEKGWSAIPKMEYR